jgi:hypothetical protein
MSGQGTEEHVALTVEEKRRQRIRSIMIGWSLAGLALLFFLVTMVKFGGHASGHSL